METGCDNSKYAGIGAFTIAFTLCFDLVLLISFIVLIIKKRTSNVAPEPNSKRNLVKENKEVGSNDEQPSNINQNVEENEEGWKEENLDEIL